MAIAEAPAPSIQEYLVDWRQDHRELSDAHRAAVGAYIRAIITREPFVAIFGIDAVGTRATELWHSFRTTYDDFRGPYARSDAEDAVRAMSRM